MNTINLQAYINNGLILTNLASNKTYDCVAYDRFANDAIDLPEDLTMVDLSTYTPKHDIGGKLLSLAQRHKKILLILTQTPTSMIAHLLDDPRLANLHIISTHHQSQQHDPAYIDATQFSLALPYDLISLFSILKQTHAWYVPIQPGEYPSKMIESTAENDINTQEDTTGHLYDCRKHNLTGNHGTILTAWWATTQAIMAQNHLQDEEIGHDLFVATQRDRKITDWLRESLEKTQKLIVIYDGNETMVKNHVYAILFAAGFCDIDVEIITPTYTWTRSQHPEYRYQEAWFTAHEFVEKLREG